MKETDVRIGNWVIDEDGEENQVTAKWFSWMAWDYCSGIPLTEKWLVKLGFRFGIDGYHLNGFAVPCIRPEYELNELCESFKDGSLQYGFKYHRDLKFVHQLQNLYFALTGEELQLT